MPTISQLIVVPQALLNAAGQALTPLSAGTQAKAAAGDKTREITARARAALVIEGIMLFSVIV
jgi:hypothetical protein